MVRSVRIAIVGGGLAGLYAAYRLHQQGMRDYVLLEARAAPGGRIVSAAAPDADRRGRFDLGPAWFWPDIQPRLDRLIRELGLEAFAQFDTGEMLVERAGGEPPLRVPGYANAPPSMRLAGGMAALAGALRDRLPGAQVITGQTVRRLRQAGGHVELDCEDSAGQAHGWRAGHVLLAVPPRLADSSIAFAPPLPPDLSRQWRATPTWMAPHAKYVAVYAAPFWRRLGLSGEARSSRGPLAEIHDASMPGAGAALFGFLGVPARVRRGLDEATLRAHCRAQLARLFGPEAARPQAEFLRDWAFERYTAAPADLDGVQEHAAAPAATADSGPWAGRLTGIASEWSRQFPGYLAGAIEAAGSGAQAMLEALPPQDAPAPDEGAMPAASSRPVP